MALLDHSYHTVLSSRSETPLNLLLMEGLVKRRWLNRPSQLQVATPYLVPVNLLPELDKIIPLEGKNYLFDETILKISRSGPKFCVALVKF